MPKKPEKFKPTSITSFIVPEKDEIESLTELGKDQVADTEESKKVRKIIQQKQATKKNKTIESEEYKLEEIDKSDLNDNKKTDNNNKNSDEEKKSFGNNININKYLSKLQKISLKDKIFFTKNLGVMIKAGLSLGQALRALADQTANKKFKKILTEVEEKVNKGTSFAESLKNHPKTFNQLFISMVESGEASGNLEEVLKQLHRQMTRDHALISKIRGAMIYPAIVIMAMIGIGIGMIVFVIPKFMSIFEEVNAELPFMTRALMNISDFMVANGPLATLCLIIITAVLIKIFKTKKGKNFLHLIFLKTPILAPIVKKVNLARFSRTLSSLLKTDIPIVKAFEITARVLGNVHYKNALNDAREKIEKGEHIRQSLEKYNKLFPPVVIQMITVGEETGALDNVLDELANFYEEDVDQTMKNLPTIIEPVLMLVLGVGVGLMAVAVLMPMYSLGQAF
ncbi:type II secretion system F family protein [Candidatus Parcubacteria bacterium]|nr:type II secretion system F family protein [Patescibacteria group bacterium]MCG2686540.1 type II secretion system F family protein [Candidatus Parcubacteria bacterium]